MTNLKYTCVLFFILIYAGCHSPASPPIVLDKDTIITLHRTMCYGNCPVYTVTIDGQGAFTLKGTRVNTAGGKQSERPIETKSGNISQDELQQLIAGFNRIDFLSLKDNYNKQGADCPNYNTDSPFAVTSIKTNNQTKSVNHYSGCEGTETLKNLTGLEQKIDEIAKTREWLK